jgi:hypothetical protein
MTNTQITALIIPAESMTRHVQPNAIASDGCPGSGFDFGGSRHAQTGSCRGFTSGFVFSGGDLSIPQTDRN